MRIFPVLLLLMLTACSGGIRLDSPNTKVGEYSVMRAYVQPKPGLDPETIFSGGTLAEQVEDLRERLQPMLAEDLEGDEGGRKVDAQVHIESVYLLVPTIIEAESLRQSCVHSRVILVDYHTQQPLGSAKVDIYINYPLEREEEQQRQILAESYADKLIETLYPESLFERVFEE